MKRKFKVYASTNCRDIRSSTEGSQFALEAYEGDDLLGYVVQIQLPTLVIRSNAEHRAIQYPTIRRANNAINKIDEYIDNGRLHLIVDSNTVYSDGPYGESIVDIDNFRVEAVDVTEYMQQVQSGDKYAIGFYLDNEFLGYVTDLSKGYYRGDDSILVGNNPRGSYTYDSFKEAMKAIDHRIGSAVEVRTTNYGTFYYDYDYHKLKDEDGNLHSYSMKPEMI